MNGLLPRPAARAAWFAAALAAALLSGHRIAADGPKLADVEQRICDAWSKLQSVSAKLVRVAVWDQPAVRTRQRTEGSYKYLRREGGDLFRMDSTIRNEVTDEEKSSAYAQSQTFVIKGEFTYTLSNQQKMNVVVKARADARARGVGGRGLFDNLHRDYNLSLQPDAVIEGAPAYVIEATPKVPVAGSTYRRSRYYFDQKSGVNVRSENLDNEGKLIDYIQYSDVVLDAKLDPSEFELEIPPDARVIDQTQSPQGTESGAPGRGTPASQPAGHNR